MALQNTIPTDPASRLAADRTRLAYERTMMAWVRTATSLITFGFTIYKFFQYQVEKGQAPADGVLGPRGFGLLMIGIGVIALVLSVVQHYNSMNTLKAAYGPQPMSVSGLVALLLSVLGLVSLIAVFMRA
jgi:putative membrane protein